MRNKRIWILGAVAATVGAILLPWLVGLPASSADTTTFTSTFTATEDTFVRDDKPTSNYGQRADLQVDSYPGVKRSLLRFHLAGLPEGSTVVSGTLRLFVVNYSKDGGAVHAVQGDWSEDTAT